LSVDVYQESGASETGGLPDWRQFKLKGIASVVVRDGERFVVEKTFNPANPRYGTVIVKV